MILLSKLNGKPMLINSEQIEYIDTIPESKIVMMNGQYHLATESVDVIMEKITEYKRQCYQPDESVVRQCLKAIRESGNEH